MTTTHRIATGIVVTLALAAAAPASATSAGADPASSKTTRAPAAVYSRQDKSMVPVTPAGTTLNAAQPVVRIQAPNGDFDWGDAGIGAAGGIALAMLGLGGALLISQRPRRTRESKAQPN